MSVRVVNKPPVYEPQHICELPNHKARKRLAVQLHTIVRCDECGTKYQWVRTGSLELGAHWVAVR